MLANNFSTSTFFAIFELIKFMCFGSTLIYTHKEFLIPRPPRSRTQSSAGSRTHPVNAVTATHVGLPAPGRILYCTLFLFCMLSINLAWVWSSFHSKAFAYNFQHCVSNIQLRFNEYSSICCVERMQYCICLLQ